MRYGYRSVEYSPDISWPVLLNDNISINRSELVGIAVDILTCLVKEKDELLAEDSEIRDIETLRQALVDFIKS